MNIKYIKYVLIILGILSIIGFSYPFLSIYIKEKSDSYLSMAVLNEYNMTENYFTNGSRAELNKSIIWNIDIKNIGTSKYVLLKIKLAEDLSKLPDQKNCIESSGHIIFEEYRIIGNDKTENIPIEWKVSSYDSNSIKMHINGRVTESMIIAYSGKEVIMVFELWLFDPIEQNFKFKWESRTQEQCVWNNIKFFIE